MSISKNNAASLTKLLRLNYYVGMLALLVALFTGIVASFGEDDWTWLARFGSVMVVTSIVMFGLAYVIDSGVTSRRASRPNAALKLLQLSLEPETEEERASLQKELLTIIETDTERAHEALELSKAAYKQYYLAAAGAVVGTLVWGFGDLLGLVF